MGRWSTGAITVNQCLKFGIADIGQYLKENESIISGVMSWSSGASIRISLKKEMGFHELKLIYTHTRTGEKCDINYTINIVSRPSNLGKGEIYYFVCPFNFKKCRVLYMAYGSQYFKSRTAYRHRLYYPSQLSSHLDRHNDNYWRLDKTIDKLQKEHPKTHYRGHPTKSVLRIDRLIERQEYADVMRWKILPKAVCNMLGRSGLTDARDLF